MTAQDFLLQYDKAVHVPALKLRELVMAHLPAIIEQVDLPAKMVMYTYGPRYKDLICNIIPSQKGLKLGFNRGTGLPDPKGLLQGTGKISRFVVIDSSQEINSQGLQNLLKEALLAYRQRA